MSEVILRPAILQDAPGIAACVCEAYVHYIERIGKQPGPMLEDYTEVVNQFQELAEAEAQEGAGDCTPTIAHAGPYSTDDCRRIVPVVALLILR
jgi:hypothetical protein